MKILKVRLRNIRSYLDQEIDFPEGTVLLSGDIGSGKSSVLLAIDFALFGITRGQLSGNALLRNGAKNGGVELHFEIDDKKIIINRSLKRGTAITQDSGFIVVNGEKKEGTAMELKQAILDIINYPGELLTKSKSLIYRYTVYTPQEEMKNILLGEKDSRIDTLRKVFGIDKYKKVRENSKILIQRFKEKSRLYEGLMEGIKEKIKEKEESKGKLNDAEKSIREISNKSDNIKEEMKKKKTEIEKAEKEAKELNELKKDLEVMEKELQGKTSNFKENKDESDKLKEEAEKIKKEIGEDEKIPGLKERIENLEAKRENIEKEIKKLIEKNAEIKTKEGNSREIIKRITELDYCMVCKQKVDEGHKKGVVKEENNRILGIQKEFESIKSNEEKLGKDLEETKKEIENLDGIKNKAEIRRIKGENLREKEKRIEKLDETIKNLKSEIGKINEKKLNISQNIENLKGLEEKYRRLRAEYEDFIEKHREIEVEKAKKISESEELKEKISRIEVEINKKEKARRSRGKLKAINEWLNSFLGNVTEMMERQVMMKIHSDFGGLFQKWFNILIEDEINVDLDEEFTPKIEQNNHDIEYVNLSGGEKTAAALSYRLALNQVINNLMVGIKTKDLLILDEPTDGFSNEQLEKMKEVLKEIDINQIIIVSHEQRIESMVNHIIRFEKRNHVTEVKW